MNSKRLWATTFFALSALGPRFPEARAQGMAACEAGWSWVRFIHPYSPLKEAPLTLFVGAHVWFVCLFRTRIRLDKIRVPLPLSSKPHVVASVSTHAQAIARLLLTWARFSHLHDPTNKLLRLRSPPRR